MTSETPMLSSRRTKRSVQLELHCGPTCMRVNVDGHDVSEAIRTLAVSAATPPVASQPAIRELLITRQREIGQALGSFVTEGRDQGSVVFPDAAIRFILDASLEVRTQRRAEELQADGKNVEISEVMDDLRARDRVDETQWAPLLAATGAVVIDTTDLTITEVVDGMVEHIQAIRPEKADPG